MDPQGLGQLCKGSVEPEIYRSMNTTVFSQTGLNPFVSSEADAEPRRDGIAGAAEGYKVSGWESL